MFEASVATISVRQRKKIVWLFISSVLSFRSNPDVCRWNGHAFHVRWIKDGADRQNAHLRRAKNIFTNSRGNWSQRKVKLSDKNTRPRVMGDGQEKCIPCPSQTSIVIAIRADTFASGCGWWRQQRSPIYTRIRVKTDLWSQNIGVILCQCSLASLKFFQFWHKSRMNLQTASRKTDRQVKWMLFCTRHLSICDPAERRKKVDPLQSSNKSYPFTPRNTTCKLQGIRRVEWDDHEDTGQEGRSARVAETSPRSRRSFRLATFMFLMPWKFLLLVARWTRLVGTGTSQMDLLVLTCVQLNFPELCNA